MVRKSDPLEFGYSLPSGWPIATRESAYFGRF